MTKLRKKKNKAVVLVLVMVSLMFMGAIGISFVQTAISNRKAANNHSNAVKAQLLAKSGIDYAIVRLQMGFEESSRYRGYRFFVPDKDAQLDPGYRINAYAEDNVGAGVSLDTIQKTHTYKITTQEVISNTKDTTDIRSPDNSGTGNADQPIDNSGTGSASQLDTTATSMTRIITDATAREPLPQDKPSFRKIINGHNVSGRINDRLLFSLKILDTSAQINVNNRGPHTAQLLNNLSKAIAKRSPYKDEVGDRVGPLKGLGRRIIRKRPRNGYRSKSALIGISNRSGTKVITKRDLEYVFDYITVFPYREDMRGKYSLDKNIKFTTLGDEKTYRRILRSPVNINTATWPVLVALFHGIQALDATIISQAEAIILANRICVRRRAKRFADLQDFYDFLEIEQDDIFTQNTLAKVELIKANIDPNVVLHRTNPDSTIAQLYNKSQLVYYTTEFCFFPLGFFEITSLGEIFDKNDTLLSAHRSYSVVKIFDIQSYRKQRDFEKNKLYPDFIGRIKGKHGFTHINNVQSNTARNRNASNFFGHIQPIWYSSLTGFSGLDEPLEIQQGGTSKPGEGGNYLFRADYNNGSLNANKANKPTAFGTKASVVASGGLAAPAPGGIFGDLMADGVVLRQKDTGANTLYYLSRPNEDPAADDPTVDGNFPALLSSPGIAPLDGSANSGSLMFWMKIGSDWNVDEWRTVAFANTATQIKDPLGGGNFSMGIQREVQVRVTAPDPQKPQLRNATVQVRSKFFCQQNGVSVAPPPALMPYEHVDFGRSIELNASDGKGLHTGEWYNIGIRWKNGNTLSAFSSGPENSSLSDSSEEDKEPKDSENSQNPPDFDPLKSENASVVVSGHFYNSEDKQQSTLMLFGQDSDYFDDNGTPVSQVDYDSKLKAEAFDPLAANLTDTNRFYVGSAGRTTSPQMTIDDIRISKDTSWGNSPSFRPSRYEPPVDPINPSHAKFHVSYTLPAETNKVLFVAPQIRSDKEEPVATETSSSSTSTLPSNIIVVGNKSMPLNDLIAIWTDMTQQPVSPDFENKLSMWTKIKKVEVKEEDEGYEKKVDMEIRDHSGDKIYDLDKDEIYSLPASEQEKYKFEVKAKKPKKNDADDADDDDDEDGDNGDITYNNPVGNTLFDRLIAWYKFRNDQDPPGMNPVLNPGAPPIIVAEPNSHKYAVQFLVKQGKPIFKSPIVDSLTLGYTQKTKFLEYRDLDR